MREFIDGNEAITRAALQAGCNFFAGYPITPATSILLHMSHELPKIGGIAIQGEDEIASIGFCIGAALTGSRVMTATSGPGISLFSESISAAIMIEIPMVIIDVQRMGPATGGPTIGAYGDIQFVRWGNSGGYPIIALTPTDVTDCYNLTLKAFELAESFRVPVFLLTDKEIGLTKSTVDTSNFNKSNIPIRENISPGSRNHHPQNPISSEIKPLSKFGDSNQVRITTSSHDEDGYITKDPKPIGAHNEHLVAKINDHIAEITSIKQDIQLDADSLIISYGITSRAAEEAILICREGGVKISHLIIHSLWPVPSIEILNALINIKHVILPELNLGLYMREIERLVRDKHTIVPINKLDGSLISPQEIIEVIRSL